MTVDEELNLSREILVIKNSFLICFLITIAADLKY
jgi:hypothetical protein